MSTTNPTNATNPTAEKQLQQGFKQFNKFMLAVWRLGLGGWVNAFPSITGQVMVVTHIGRKTGTKRRTPVNYAIVDGDVYCAAAFGGGSDWYRNIIANPCVEVGLPEGWWAGVAEEVVDPDARTVLMRAVLDASGLAANAAGIDPGKMSDEELEATTARYRLIRVRRTTPLTGRGGPGDLAWLWPLATMALLPMTLSRRKR